MKRIFFLFLLYSLFFSCNKKDDNLSTNNSSSVNFCAGFTLIPDTAFEQSLITLGYDTIMDGKIRNANICYVDTLTLLGYKYQSQYINNPILSPFIDSNIKLNGNITNLEGIEGFRSLKVLLCDSNKISVLDISNNSSLIFLSCSNNELTTIDVSSNTDLITLICSANNLTNLDVSHNIYLKWLVCGENSFNNLDLENNSVLTDFWCVPCTGLNTIDLSNNDSLVQALIVGSQLISLDFSNNFMIENIWLDNNPNLTCLNLKNGNNQNINHLQLVNCNNLSCIEVDDPNLASINFGSSFDGSFSNNCNYPTSCF